MASGDTKTNQYLDVAANGTRADLPTDTCCETRTQTLVREVAERIIGVEEEVERLENNPDVVDIVATYQDLQSYDTSGLTDKDIIRVLEDSTHNNNSTYYRWNAATNQFDFVGEISGGGESGGATALTTADYNYPAANPTGVALWLLEPGVYYRENSNVIVYCSSAGVVQTSERLGDTYTMAIVGAPSSNGGKQAILVGGSYSGMTGTGKQNVTRSYFLTSTGSVSASTNLIGDANIVDNLASNYTKQPLSANQGRVLNEKFGGMQLVSITQTAYDALATKDPNTLYVITGA